MDCIFFIVGNKALDRKTAAFYLALLGLVVFDLVLMVWAFNPFTNLGMSAYASQKVPAVSDAPKPSPFELADSRSQTARRKPKLSNALTGEPHY